MRYTALRFCWGPCTRGRTEMKLKFMTPRQANKDEHRLKEKIEKERIEKEEIYTAEGREIEEKEKEEKIKEMEKEVEKQIV